MAKFQAEKFWDQVDKLAQEKIYHLLTTDLPFQNIPLITEPYRFEDTQQKKVGLFLGRDTDYRVLTDEIENNYYDQELPSPEQLAEEIAVNYFHLVFKSLLTDLSDCYGYDSSYFSLENLIN